MDNIRYRYTEGGKYGRGGEDIDLLNSQISGIGGSMYRTGTPERIDVEFFRNMSRANDLFSYQIAHMRVDNVINTCCCFNCGHPQGFGDLLLDGLFGLVFC